MLFIENIYNRHLSFLSSEYASALLEQQFLTMLSALPQPGTAPLCVCSVLHRPTTSSSCISERSTAGQLESQDCNISQQLQNHGLWKPPIC